jgi:predicted porin
VTYDFGPAAVNYLYAKSYVNGTNAGSNTTNTFGVKVPYDKFTLGLSYGSGSIDSYATTATTAVSKDATATDVTLGLTYNFDKSTSVYFLGSKSTYSNGLVQTGANDTYAIGARYVF